MQSFAINIHLVLTSVVWSRFTIAHLVGPSIFHELIRAARVPFCHFDTFSFVYISCLVFLVFPPSFLPFYHFCFVAASGRCEKFCLPAAVWKITFLPAAAAAGSPFNSPGVFFMGRGEATLSRSHLGHALVSVFPAHLLFFSLLAWIRNVRCIGYGEICFDLNHFVLILQLDLIVFGNRFFFSWNIEFYLAFKLRHLSAKV